MSRYNAYLPVLDAGRLHHEPKDKSLTAFASDIDFKLAQLYSDACDEGLLLLSPKTGQKLPCYATPTIREGDITHWTLRPCPYAVMRPEFAAMIDYTITIWND